MLFLIPYEVYMLRQREGSCNNVTQLSSNQMMNIDPRIKQEREVTFLASVEPAYRRFSWELPMLDLDDEAGWHNYYNVAKTDREFQDLESAVKALVAARVEVRAQTSQATIVQNKEEQVRRVLMACIQRKMERDAHDLQGLVLPF